MGKLRVLHRFITADDGLPLDLRDSSWRIFDSDSLELDDHEVPLRATVEFLNVQVGYGERDFDFGIIVRVGAIIGRAFTD